MKQNFVLRILMVSFVVVAFAQGGDHGDSPYHTLEVASSNSKTKFPKLQSHQKKEDDQKQKDIVKDILVAFFKKDKKGPESAGLLD